MDDGIIVAVEISGLEGWHTLIQASTCVYVLTLTSCAATELYVWRVQVKDSLINGRCLIDKKYIYDPFNVMGKTCNYCKYCEQDNKLYVHSYMQSTIF